ncbi:PQQ-binding-like beta-propeller repeat protein [Mangrovibacterium sp.]|uniref:outer membrane protein assembly factor BamB family protein n=1 Tax=Mangrovibacterium sp. TaxID=1961364 RepID=UPI0035644CF5
MILKINVLLVLSLWVYWGFSQNATQWRGLNSEGKYPAPSLLNEWPENGPEIIWHFDDLGKGFSSPAFANGLIYCTGMIDSTGYLFVINENGTLNKKLAYGEEWTVNYPGSRATPTIAGHLAYVSSSLGNLYCFNLDEDRIVWKKELTSDFGAENIRNGFTETPVIEDDVVYFTPGGTEFNIVALNRMNGDLIWKSPGTGKISAYCTPKLVTLDERQVFVTHTKGELIAVDTKDGAYLWSYPDSNTVDIHPNTPIIQDQAILSLSGYGTGCVKLALSDDGSSVSNVWSSTKMDNQMGGAMIVDGFVYGSGHRSRGWFCLDWQTGEEKWNSRELLDGVIIMVANKFILYTERGDLVLAKPNPEKLEIISKAKVELGSDMHWAHPVVHNGILYVRHGHSLIAYKISA